MPRLGTFIARARSSRKIPAQTHLYNACIGRTFFLVPNQVILLVIVMSRLVGNQNHKWSWGTWCCVVNLDLCTFGPHPRGSYGGHSNLSFYVGVKGR